MNRQDFYQLLVVLPRLNLQQWGHLQEALAHPGKRSPLLDELEVRFNKHSSCPKCKLDKVHRWGLIHCVQHYRCSHCHKTFTALTNTPLAY